MNHPWSALWLVSSILVLACDKGSSAGEPTPPASASVAVPATTSAPALSAPAAEKPREKGPGHGGVDAVLFRAAHGLTLSDAQRAKLAVLEGQLHDRDTDPRDALKTFSNDLAAQIRAGKIDSSKLQADEAALDTAMSIVLGKQSVALAGLHEALDAGQRKALADAVRAKAAAREAEAKDQDGGAGDPSARRLDRMATDLGLDPGQQKQVAALLAKQPSLVAMRDDTNKRMDAILTAFQADAFDAQKVLQPTTKAPHDAMDRQIAFTSQLLAVLHPDQREKLAVSTAKRGGRGRPGESWSDEDDGHGGGGGGGGGD
jgi:Spy/CpxP family protein refolding chaperone